MYSIFIFRIYVFIMEAQFSVLCCAVLSDVANKTCRLQIVQQPIKMHNSI